MYILDLFVIALQPQKVFLINNAKKINKIFMKTLLTLLIFISLSTQATAQLFIANLIPDDPEDKFYYGAGKAIQAADSSGFYTVYLTKRTENWDGYPYKVYTGIQIYKVSYAGVVTAQYHREIVVPDSSDLELSGLYSNNFVLLEDSPGILIAYLPYEGREFKEVTIDSITYWQEISTKRFTLKAYIDLSVDSVKIDTIADFFDKLGPEDSDGCYYYSTGHSRRIGKICRDTFFSIPMSGWTGGIWGDTLIDNDPNQYRNKITLFDTKGDRISEHTIYPDTIDDYRINYSYIYGGGFFENSTFLTEIEPSRIDGSGVRKHGVALFDHNFELMFRLIFPKFGSNWTITKTLLTPRETYILAGNTSSPAHISILEFSKSGELLWHNIYPFYFDFPADMLHDLIVTDDAMYALVSNQWDERVDDEEKRMWFIKLTRQGGLSKIGGDALITKTSLTVYPNPSRDIFHVYTDRQLTNVKYQVFSSTGKLLLTGHCEDSNDISINLSGYPAGLYLLHVSSADKNAGQTVKLVKTE